MRLCLFLEMVCKNLTFLPTAFNALCSLMEKESCGLWVLVLLFSYLIFMEK